MEEGPEDKRGFKVQDRRRFSAEGELTAFFPCKIDIEFNFIELRLIHDRALFGFLVERIALAQLCRSFDKPFRELLVYRFLDEEARAAQTNLALVCERGSHATGNGSVEIGIGKNYVWIFSAELERNFFE